MRDIHRFGIVSLALGIYAQNAGFAVKSGGLLIFSCIAFIVGVISLGGNK